MASQPKMSFRTEAFINNEFVKGSQTFPTFNPATEELLADVALCREQEVNQAVDAARYAFEEGEWSKMSGFERAALMQKLADLMEQNKEELALLETLDNGKPIRDATAADIPMSILFIRYYAGWADKISGTTVEPDHRNNTFMYVGKEPVGVVGQIIPWNFPLLMLAWKLGPALATGCTVVVKTAPQTPLSALRIAELVLEAGFPPGVVNILPGDDETGKLVARHPGFDKIAFTGSTEVGKLIMQEAACGVRRVSLELGGKSPLVVFDDADIDRAVIFAYNGLFFNQGQCCCAGSRIFVQEGIYDTFVQKVTDLAKARKLGVGWDFETEQGPQVSQEQYDRVRSYIKSGLSSGAKCLVGGDIQSEKGYFVAPTVFTDVTDDMQIAREEIFGPVMSILKFRTEEEVLKRANATNYGLASSVFTKDMGRAHRYAQKIKAGSVWVNCYNHFDPRLPFGGFKESGIGREGGEAGLLQYLEHKTVVFSL